MCEETLTEIMKILKERLRKYETEIEEFDRAKRGVGEYERKRILKKLMDYIDEDYYIFFNPS
jgi:hypothetical protein